MFLFSSCIKSVKWYLFLIVIISCHAFASGQLTNIGKGVSIYSEYYPNPHAKFKGTIIFENGSGTDITEWKSSKAFFNCAKTAGSLFMYDRNGIGKSPVDMNVSSHRPITAKLVSDKLFILLKKLNIKPPYVIVAHSYGAIYAGYFTLKHPHLVRGLLLIDPSPRKFDYPKKVIAQYESGINDAKNHSSSYMYKKYNPLQVEGFYQLLAFKTSKKLIEKLGPISNAIPVIIISSTGMENEQPLLNQDWYNSQKQWLNKNHYSKIIQVSSSHFIQLDQPQKVCQELKNIGSSRLCVECLKSGHTWSEPQQPNRI